jgi:transcriptional regulator with XRE-family HTH domain
LDYSEFEFSMALQFIQGHMEKTLHQREYHILLDLLREVRLDAGISQIELASLLDMTQSMVSKVERGERRLDVIELRNWCTVIRIPYLQFLERFEGLLQAGPGRPKRNRK